MNATGGPGSGTPLMNNGGPRAEQMSNSNRQQLNTYIYDYFLKNHHYELARALQRELPINASPHTKTSPSGREVNGVDDSMDADGKEDGPKRPSDLPVPTIFDHTEGSFLYDWWCQFWDIWSAHRRKIPAGAAASQYLAHAQVRFLDHLCHNISRLTYHPFLANLTFAARSTAADAPRSGYDASVSKHDARHATKWHGHAK